MYHIVLFDISKQEQFIHVFVSIQVYQISYLTNTLWNILRIDTQLVNYLICNQQFVVSIAFLNHSNVNKDFLTRFGTVRLTEQFINWSDYVICINVHSNSPVWYMCQAIRINIGITQWLRHSNLKCQLHTLSLYVIKGRRGRDRMVVGFTTTYAISAYHHWCCEFDYRSGRGVQHYVIKFVSDLQQVDGFLRVLQFPQPIKLTATI